MKQVKINLNDFVTFSGCDELTNCGSGRCPRVLINNSGDVIIQGISLPTETFDAMKIPEGENAIYLSKEILSELKIELKRR